MSPSGLGLRLMSRQLQPLFALVGDKCPFDCSAGSEAVSKRVEACPLTFDIASDCRLRTGLRLFVRAECRMSSCEPLSSSKSSCIGDGVTTLLLAADLVTGAK